MHYMFIHAMLAAAAPTAGVWLTRHGPRNEIQLPWPFVSHPSALQTCDIDSRIRQPYFVMAQLTRASAGGWIVIPPGGGEVTPQTIGRHRRRTGTLPPLGMQQRCLHSYFFH